MFPPAKARDSIDVGAECVGQLGGYLESWGKLPAFEML